MKEYREGKQACRIGIELQSNPYPTDSQEAINWVQGWLMQDAIENREYIGLGSSNIRQY